MANISKYKYTGPKQKKQKFWRLEREDNTFEDFSTKKEAKKKFLWEAGSQELYLYRWETRNPVLTYPGSYDLSEKKEKEKGSSSAEYVRNLPGPVTLRPQYD